MTNDNDVIIPDFRALPPEEFAKLPDVIQFSVLSSRSKATSRDELERDVMRLLRWRLDREMKGMSLRELNRRFGQVAVSLGFSVRDLLEGLHYKKQAELVRVGRALIAIDWRWRAEINEMFAETPHAPFGTSAEDNKLIYITDVLKTSLI